jgi:endonuclease/exonuclease/phosphatase family metal-dependent hydrolase
MGRPLEWGCDWFALNNEEACVRAGLPTIILLVLVAGVTGLLGWWAAAAQPGARGVPEGASTQRAGGDAGVVRVMTANVRFLEPADGINAWQNRREFLVKTLLKYGSDVIGCQEVTPAQGAYLTKELAKWYDHYPRAGVASLSGEKAGGGELMGAVNETFAALNTLFYKADRFEIVAGESGLVLPEQLQADAAENTFYTLAVLKEKQPEARSQKPGALWIVVNTHLRHREVFAENCAAKIREKIGAARKKYPEAQVVLMGDMNHDRGTKIYGLLVGKPDAADGAGMLADSFDYTKKAPGEAWGNWHAFTGVPRAAWPTDLILLGDGTMTRGTQIVRDRDGNGRYPSDHFFVMTDVIGK